MGFKVGDKYRTNPLSFKPGGYTVVVELDNGRQFEYTKVKYPVTYIKTIKRNKNVRKVWIKDMDKMFIDDIDSFLDKMNNK